MSDNAKITINDQELELPVIVGTENEVGLDITKMRGETGAITLDNGYGNTGSCKSAITYFHDRNLLKDLEALRVWHSHLVKLRGHA